MKTNICALLAVSWNDIARGSQPTQLYNMPIIFLAFELCRRVAQKLNSLRHWKKNIDDQKFFISPFLRSLKAANGKFVLEEKNEKSFARRKRKLLVFRKLFLWVCQGSFTWRHVVINIVKRRQRHSLVSQPCYLASPGNPSQGETTWLITWTLPLRMDFTVHQLWCYKVSLDMYEFKAFNPPSPDIIACNYVFRNYNWLELTPTVASRLQDWDKMLLSCFGISYFTSIRLINKC